MALVKSGLLRTLPKSSLRVLLVSMTVAKWSSGMFEAGHKGTASLAGLDPRDVRSGIDELLRLGIVERIHKGVSSLDRSVYRFNLERIREHGKSKGDALPVRGWVELLNAGGSGEKPRRRKKA